MDRQNIEQSEGQATHARKRLNILHVSNCHFAEEEYASTWFDSLCCSIQESAWV